jgi:NADH-quinone oxidoreductase subunit I
MWTVPAPPPLDPAAEEPKELVAARKAAAKLAAEQQAATADGHPPDREAGPHPAPPEGGGES